MNTSKILKFLKAITVNNNRQWFADHRKEYELVRKDFEHDISKAIDAIAVFDSSVSHLTVKDVTYRFNRDTRFSADKSPYKRHFGAYISAHGKKSLHGGYYIHVEPGNCLLACGCYCLPTNILTACRNEIMGNIDTWRGIVEQPLFVETFGKVGCKPWGDIHGFGIEHLKTCPSGFPRDYEFIEYLRMKDYCCWQQVPDDFFAQDDWIEKAIEIFKIAKPMMDFINNVVDDYE